MLEKQDAPLRLVSSTDGPADPAAQLTEMLGRAGVPARYEPVLLGNVATRRGTRAASRPRPAQDVARQLGRGIDRHPLRSARER